MIVPSVVHARMATWSFSSRSSECQILKVAALRLGFSATHRAHKYLLDALSPFLICASVCAPAIPMLFPYFVSCSFQMIDVVAASFSAVFCGNARTDSARFLGGGAQGGAYGLDAPRCRRVDPRPERHPARRCQRGKEGGCGPRADAPATPLRESRIEPSRAARSVRRSRRPSQKQPQGRRGARLNS